MVVAIAIVRDLAERCFGVSPGRSASTGSKSPDGGERLPVAPKIHISQLLSFVGMEVSSIVLLRYNPPARITRPQGGDYGLARTLQTGWTARHW